MSIRVNPRLKHSPHTIQDMHGFLLLNMYKHFKNNFSALWVYAMQVNGVQKFQGTILRQVNYTLQLFLNEVFLLKTTRQNASLFTINLHKTYY